MTLYRSLSRLPSTHFVTLNFPWCSVGHDAVKRINQFFGRLEKLVGCELYYYWWYDGQVKGHFPHVHVLVRSKLDISAWNVYLAWAEVWTGEVIEEKDTHVRMTDENIWDIAKYVTKHGKPIQRVPKSLWSGPLQGGCRKFWVTSRKTLWSDPHYCTQPEEEWCRLQSQFLEEWGSYWLNKQAVIVAETAVDNLDLGGDQVEIDSSLYIVFSSIDHVSLTLCPRLTTVRVPPRTGLGNLLYSIWPIPPPGTSWGRTIYKEL
ncbi:hypothetical protein R5W24_003336 [Gemmata sp. JC717]|uniref:hypothetical protein n=1 Tax=Gemmata algarum TaxID=2975278 RepID=UPI0021BB12FA|nr:hypothetical protein [Gemmata algarum]MDY3554217.1 hypothetical protein [Gemmata algarum]